MCGTLTLMLNFPRQSWELFTWQKPIFGTEAQISAHEFRVRLTFNFHPVSRGFNDTQTHCDLYVSYNTGINKTKINKYLV